MKSAKNERHRGIKSICRWNLTRRNGDPLNFARLHLVNFFLYSFTSNYSTSHRISMPRELKKRGRREEKKRRAEEVELEPTSPKRQRTEDEPPLIHQDLEVHGDAGDDYISFGESNQPAPLQQDEFYGLLEEDEQTYYANVNNKLSSNDFESDEDRAMFIEAVHRETTGKELKVASSQSCSRYLEKVIFLSTPAQLKSLFNAFLENLTYLVQHRFGSHCCEALFLEAAKHVMPKEVTSDEEATMESLFLRAVDQMQPNIGFMVTDRFATHAIRVLMLILSGEPLDEESSKMVASRKKEKIDLPEEMKSTSDIKRKIPHSFPKALGNMIAAAVSTLDTTYIRALATHPTGNPFLQLALKLELSRNSSGKEKTEQVLFSKLFPDSELEADSESGKFIQGLVYDPTGSHLVEILIKHLPGKTFKKLYANILKERMGTYARNDVASYIAIRVIERLGKDDLAEVQLKILPEISGLVDRSRTGLIKTLFERLSVRQADATPITEAIRTAYGGEDLTIIPKMLQLHTSIEHLSVPNSKLENASNESSSPTRADLHGSLLAQTMLNAPIACDLIQGSLLVQSVSTLILMAKNPIASRVLQVAFTSENSMPAFRKQFVPKFQDDVAEIALDAAGSHVVDALWSGTNGLHFIKERLASKLAQNESALRESMYGRNVWRNWSMDAYQRRRGEWQAVAKGRTQDQAPDPDKEPKKSAIQLARERHAKNKGARKPDVDTTRSQTVPTSV